MPDSSVQTIKDQLFFQYVKIIACSAYHCHLCKGDLDKPIDGISVLDLDL